MSARTIFPRIVAESRISVNQAATSTPIARTLPLRYSASFQSRSSSSSLATSRRRKGKDESLEEAGEEPIEKMSGNANADLVGPPDPISNIRPVIYATPSYLGSSKSTSADLNRSGSGSSSSPNARASSSASSSPYSVSEFSNVSSSFSHFTPPSSIDPENAFDARSLAARRPTQSASGWTRFKTLLGFAAPSEESEKIRQDRRTGEELEWRLRMERLDRRNHEFWGSTNALFESHMARRLAQLPAPADPSKLTEQESEAREKVLSEFYRDWVLANRQRQSEWVREWWTDLRKMIWATWRRDWRRLSG